MAAEQISNVNPDNKSTQPGKGSTWYQDFLPHAGRGAERVTVDNPLGVRVPDGYAKYAPLISVLPHLTRDFATYYQAQTKRIKAESVPIRLSKQRAFEQEARRFVDITRGVTDIAQQKSHTPLIVFSDLDETAGSVVERWEPIRLPDFPDLRVENMTPEQKSRYRELSLQSIYMDFAFSPGYIQAVNYLHDTFDNDPGISFGILSTKAQAGMSKYLFPTLEEVIPHAFREMLILSSKDGVVDELVPEVAALTQDRWNNPTLRQAFTAFIDSSPSNQRAILQKQLTTNHDRVTERALNEPLTDFDIKLFLLTRMQQNLRTTVEEQYRQEVPTANYGRWADQLVPPDTTFVLLDDAKVPSRLFQNQSLHVISLEPWRLPDAPAIPRVHGRRF